MTRSASGDRFRPNLESLERREVPAAYTTTPVIPTLDAAQVARLVGVIQQGHAQGNRLDVFARAGDSITASSNFLTPLARPSVGVDLAGDGSLADALAFFRAGRIGADNSFGRTSIAAHPGWTSADVLAHLPGELATSKPGFVLVMAGTNDDDLQIPLDAFRQYMTGITQVAFAAGVVPILSTIPDHLLDVRHEAAQPGYNQVIQDVGDATGAPVLNLWRAFQRLPNLGISADGVHPSLAPAGGGDFTASGLQFGYNVRNLTTLQTLDKLRRVLLLGATPDLPDAGATWAPLDHALPVAAGDTTGFQVQVIDTVTRQTLFRFDPFPRFAGAVHVAQGDVNGDGTPDLVAAAGPGGPPHVKVFDGRTGALLTSFYAFDANMTAGLSVAAGDVNGDGRADLIVCPGPAPPAHVKAFAVEGGLLASFYAFAPGFLGGGRVAAGDTNGDGRADIVAAAGPGGHGHVAVFSGADLGPLASFFPMGADFGGDVTVAAGDVDGHGRAEVAVAVSAGGAPRVVVFRPPDETLLSSFYAYDPGYPGGVELAVAPGTGGRAVLVTASAGSAFADVRILAAPTIGLLGAFPLYVVGFSHGLAFGS